MSLLPLLHRFEEHLREMQAPVVDHLAPGLPRDTAAARLTEHFGWMPDDLVDWFTWHDGVVQPASDPPPFWWTVIIGWSPLSLDGALSSHAQLDPVLRGQHALSSPEPAEPMVHELWLPLMHNSLVKAHLHVQPAGETQRLEVWREDHAETPRRIAASLSELVSAWLDAFERGGLYYDQKDRAWQARSDDPAIHERFIKHPGVV